MKHSLLYGSLGAIALLVAGLVTSAFSQPGANGPQRGGQPGPGQGMPPGPPPPRATMLYVADNLYVLQGGTLTKYAADTLAEAGTLTLMDPPAANGNADGQRPPMRPPMGGILLAPEGGNGQLLVLAGDTFFRIDADAMQIKVKKELPAPQIGEHGAGGQGMRRGPQEPGNGGPGGGMGIPRGPMHHPQPVTEIHGKTLYLLRGPQLLAVNTETGEVTGQAVTAEPPAPK